MYENDIVFNKVTQLQLPVLVKFRSLTSEGLILSQVPEFLILVKLLAHNYDRVSFYVKIACFYFSFSKVAGCDEIAI